MGTYIWLLPCSKDGTLCFCFGTTATDNSGNIVGIGGGDQYTVYSDYKKHSKSLTSSSSKC
jgi:hypothetical protein